MIGLWWELWDLERDFAGDVDSFNHFQYFQELL
jgi:hypothetical protein